MSTTTSVRPAAGKVAGDSPKTCGKCGRPAERLGKSARTGAELAALPLMGPCCFPKLRKAPAGALTTFLGAL